jgi:dihydrofolate reductase
MRKLIVFNFTSLNGYFKDRSGDTGWHQHGAEENDFAIKKLETGSTLLFGRVTYEMMSSYWPTPAALQHNPSLAKGMNQADKIVFSTKLKKADWHNTRVIRTDMIQEVKNLKKQSGNEMTVLGSGSISSQLAEHGLIDEYQIMIDPILIGQGVSLFGNIQQPRALQLHSVREFNSGVVLLTYQPKN